MDRRPVSLIFPLPALGHDRVAREIRREFGFNETKRLDESSVELGNPWFVDLPEAVSCDWARGLVIVFENESLGGFLDLREAVREAGYPFDEYDVGDCEEAAAITFWRRGLESMLVSRQILVDGTPEPVILWRMIQGLGEIEFKRLMDRVAVTTPYDFDIDQVPPAARQAMAPWIHQMMPL